MKKISIVTDTDSSLPPALAAEYDVQQVPILIHFGEEVFETGVDINDRDLFERVDREGKLPTTAAPSPGKFAKFFQNAFEEDEADAVICFCISGAMSATIKSAQTAARDLLPEKNITVVDTETLSMGQGFMVLAAAEAAKNGASIDEIIQAAEETRARSHLYGALATLKYLSMSGRVSHLAASMAGMMDIKPILSVQSGKLDMLEKVRTRKKAWERVIELAREDAKGAGMNRTAVLHVNAPEEAEKFTELLRNEMDCPAEILTAELTPGLSVHTGTGLVALAFTTC